MHKDIDLQKLEESVFYLYNCLMSCESAFVFIRGKEKKVTNHTKTQWLKISVSVGQLASASPRLDSARLCSRKGWSVQLLHMVQLSWDRWLCYTFLSTKPAQVCFTLIIDRNTREGKPQGGRFRSALRTQSINTSLEKPSHKPRLCTRSRTIYAMF